MAKRIDPTKAATAPRKADKVEAAASGSQADRSGEQAPAPSRTRRDRTRTHYQTRDFKTVLARVNRDGWKELKKLSAETDTSFQDIFIEALNQHLKSKGFSPVVESRVFPKD